jgi:2-oxoglutarate ferredoxin oxidoreductase subunit beta
MLVRMNRPHFPIAMGVIRACASEVYEDMLDQQINHAKATSKIRSVDDLLKSGSTFSI